MGINEDPTKGLDGVAARDKCFTASNRNGLMAEISGSDVVVYDPDAPCPNGGSFIHFAGREFVPMTAGAGPFVHTYHAGIFPAPMGMVAISNTGKCAMEFNRSKPGKDEITWQIAASYRGGSCEKPME